MRLIYIFIFLTSVIYSQNKIKATPVLKSNLSHKSIIKGNLLKALEWKDKLGNNMIIISETGIYRNKEENSNAEIFAYHFLNKSETPNWKIYDYEKDCSVDVEASFVKNSLEITDLDNDNIAEIWIVYKTACRGDISPRTLKIIMYENNIKYSLRGEERIVIKQESLGGKYSFDSNFRTASKIFRDYALKKWNKYFLVNIN